MSFPRYPKYKDSGVEWLGKIPEHWSITRIKQMSRSIEQGWSPQCEGFPVESESEWGVLKVGCVNGGKFDPSENKALPPDLDPVPSLTLVAGDLLISRANTRELVGSAAVVERDYGHLMLCDKLYRLRMHGEYSAKFICRYLESARARGQVELRATGASASMLNIGQSTILSLQAAVPGFAEQVHIAAFLDRETAKIDALVAEQRRLMDLLKEKRQAVISHAVTKGLNPDVPMKDTGIEWLGEVPAHWSVVPLKYLVRMTSGGTPSKANSDYWDGNVPWASSKDMKVEELADTEDHITQMAVDEGAAELVPTGSILIVVRGMILAHTFPVVRTLAPLAINQDLKALAPARWLEADYLLWLLRGSAPETLARVDEAAHGTTVLRMDVWTSMPFPVPPIEEQKQIARMLQKELRQLDELASDVQRSIDLLLERRATLISAAVTGQIDVRELGAQNTSPEVVAGAIA